MRKYGLRSLIFDSIFSYKCKFCNTWYFNPSRTPEAVGAHLQKAIDWIDDKPALATPERLVMIYAWNEFGEGGYIAPTVGDPDGLYLDAIESVVLIPEPATLSLLSLAGVAFLRRRRHGHTENAVRDDCSSG